MITNDIQELFDGGLGDEQSAELFHTLSVSPERRIEFQRHLMLQGAMQADRFDNRLRSDEDAAVWGAIAGAGLVATSAGGGYALGWLVKPVLFVLAGVVGYILGTTTLDTFTGEGLSQGSSTKTGAEMPLIAVIPVPYTPHAQPVATSSAPAAVAAHANAPRVKNLAPRIAAVSASSEADVVTETNRSAHVTTPKRSGVENPAAVDASAVDAKNDRATVPTTVSKEPDASLNAPSVPAQTVDSTQRQASGAGTTQTSAARTSATRPLTTDDVERALRAGNAGDPIETDGQVVAALRTDGFEVGYGHMVGVFDRGGALASGQPKTMSNPHIDLGYAFMNGAMGVGVRLGYGDFSLQSLKSIQVARPSSGNITSGTESVYSMVAETRQLFIAGTYLSYRFPIGNRAAIGAEGSFGLSAQHLQAGGNLSMLFFLTDRIGLRGGVGYDRYWYSLDAGDARSMLLNDGDAIDESFVNSVSGGFLEGRIGVLFHL